MAKLLLQLEVEYDQGIMHADDPDGRNWFFKDVLGGELILHSNEIGDSIGPVKVLSWETEPFMPSTQAHVIIPHKNCPGGGVAVGPVSAMYCSECRVFLSAMCE